jgi:hypothetical protein
MLQGQVFSGMATTATPFLPVAGIIRNSIQIIHLPVLWLAGMLGIHGLTHLSRVAGITQVSCADRMLSWRWNG